jgi:hypothetical protein
VVAVGPSCGGSRANVITLFRLFDVNQVLKSQFSSPIKIFLCAPRFSVLKLHLNMFNHTKNMKRKSLLSVSISLFLFLELSIGST